MGPPRANNHPKVTTIPKRRQFPVFLLPSRVHKPSPDYNTRGASENSHIISKLIKKRKNKKKTLGVKDVI